ncbi:MAG: type I methionyl aminopeptidase [Ruminococcaceae bacterium]|nr:type I methionyl aminopeptidase [Oscillospiraceae bacterium]MBQ8323655.1 type I methionyl aminopeptidase [Clostridia bacterium]
MIILKSTEEIRMMRDAGRIAATARAIGGEHCKEGVTTAQIDAVIRKTIKSMGATPSFLNLYGFPASACISVNEEVIHGIPSNRVLKNGDIVKIDVGAMYKGYHGDCAATFAVGEISEEAKKLIEVTRQSFFQGLQAAEREGARLGDIGNAIQTYVESFGYSVVRDFVGHGIGKKVHEDPEVPNYGRAGRGIRLCSGMTLAVEPMINAGVYSVHTLSNQWTVVTDDGKLSSHFENTFALTDNGAVILTDPS